MSDAPAPYNPDGTPATNLKSNYVYVKPHWRVALEDVMVNEGPKWLFFLVWAAVQAVLFFQSYVKYDNNTDFVATRDLMGTSLPTARGAAAVLNFNCGIILLSVCRNLITILRGGVINRFIPVDKHITFHKYIAWTIAIFAIVHVGAHAFNFLRMEQALNDNSQQLASAQLPGDTALEALFTTAAGLTGIVLVTVMLIMYAAAMEKIRRKYFELFWYSHHLFIVFFAMLLSHGAQCLIHDLTKQNAPCVPTFWKWFILSGVIYLIERIWREIRARRATRLTKIVQHPSKVIEIQFKKPSMTYKSGQYLFLNCPELSRFEWHPFTISSAPEEEYVSVHIRVVGDWTENFAKRCGCSLSGDDEPTGMEVSQLPRILVDGAFGAASEDAFKYEVAVLIGAGIGVTPFSSILKSIWFRVINPTSVMKLRKAYFFWVSRDTEAFEWFQNLLEALEAEDIDNFLDINIYLTGNLNAETMRNVILNDSNGMDSVTGLRSPTQYGRPDFDKIFGNVATNHPSTDIGVFFCGPAVLSHELHRLSNKYTSSAQGGTKFYYNKENF